MAHGMWYKSFKPSIVEIVSAYFALSRHSSIWKILTWCSYGNDLTSSRDDRITLTAIKAFVDMPMSSKMLKHAA